MIYQYTVEFKGDDLVILNDITVDIDGMFHTDFVVNLAIQNIFTKNGIVPEAFNLTSVTIHDKHRSKQVSKYLTSLDEADQLLENEEFEFEDE